MTVGLFRNTTGHHLRPRAQHAVGDGPRRTRAGGAQHRRRLGRGCGRHSGSQRQGDDRRHRFQA
eukprot:3410758-Pyramimonas_sp.AAC.3